MFNYTSFQKYCLLHIPHIQTKFLLFSRVCKNPVKFISGWPGLFAGLEMLNPVRPVVLEVEPGLSGQVNDRIPEFRSSGGFSGGKEKEIKLKEFCFGFFFFF